MPLARFEVMRRFDVTALGTCTEPDPRAVTELSEERGEYALAGWGENHKAMAGSRGIGACLHQVGAPLPHLDDATLVGSPHSGSPPDAITALGGKHAGVGGRQAREDVGGLPTSLLNRTPGNGGRPRIRELIGAQIADLTVKGTSTDGVRPHLFEHAPAASAAVPVRETVPARHALSGPAPGRPAMVDDQLRAS
ncbi:acetoacetate decarboxylase [Streptomyces sp. A0642]|uniref:acetoacetate decarboxylase n=1 Tax=Streptomyces sp. A0642 TaxID=2563100 RepID=UPI0010A23DF7|nr:acetoacetate decarboxylase [Streptomyces sp. A0642]THA75637.1 acetoacetate decarboxylase [Streptomyces sp. A0642]